MQHIKTERLKLRPVKAADLVQVHELHCFPETDEFNTLGIPENIEVTTKILNGWVQDYLQVEIQNYTFVMEFGATNDFVGLIALKLGNRKFKAGEVWCKLYPSQWNRGFATEALIGILDFGFDELRLHRVEAGCAVANLGSIKVLEKAGMSREGRKRQILPLKWGWSDNFEYAITGTDARVRKNT